METRHYICTATVHTSDGENNYQAYFHLFELGDGTREFDYVRGTTSITDHTYFRAYNLVVLPWMHGQYTNQAVRDWAAQTAKT